MDIISIVEKRLNYLDLSGADRSFGGSFYRKYFEGYIETTEINKKGHNSIVRVYADDYYYQDLTKHTQILLKFAYVLCIFATTAMFIWCSTRKIQSNTTWYVALTHAFIIAGIARMAVIVFFSYLPMKQKMTIYEYKSSVCDFNRTSIITAAFFGLSAFMTAFFALINPEKEPGMTLLTVAGLFLSGLIFLLMNQTEKKISYTKIKGAIE
jgi:hypothetical protein